jgi:excisionase family DNA binding protein
VTEPNVIDAVLAEELTAIDGLPDYLTREEAWTFLRVTERTVDRMLERGELARRRFGGRTVIPRASLRACVLRQAGLDPDWGGELAGSAARFGGTQTPERKDST